MIKNLYETHLQVKDLNTSIEFYNNLGLELSLLIEDRRIAFFYIGKDRQLLGLWEVPEPIVHTWMPAAAIYFNDPDGNELEFISWLQDEPHNLGYAIYLSEWNELIKTRKAIQ
jgi:lactoylglutathione lyase